MADPVTEDRAVAHPESPALPAGTVPVSLKVGTQRFRFDGPESSLPDADDVSSVSTPAVSEPASPFSDKARLLAEAGQFMLQFQQQLEDINRREQQLTQRLTQFEREERRFRLWANDFEAELTDRKAAFQQQEAALAQRLSDFEHQQRAYDAALDLLTSDRQTLDRERAELRRQIQEELAAEKQALEAERLSLQQQQVKVRELGDELLEQHQQQQLRVEQQLQQEREQLWTRLSGEQEEHRQQFEREKAEFLKERTLLENRLRFQQDHLEKTRADLERDRHHALCEQQAMRQQLEVAGIQGLNRKRQLDRYRQTLEELERALDREAGIQTRLKAALTSNAEQEQQQYRQERQAWEEERRQQQTELRRQQELLLTHTENLETRRLRLEALKREVEETSHSTMELRLAVEEVWAQLQQSLGLTITQERVDAARQIVASDYELWQARLWEQRRELHEAERYFEQQRLVFQAERRTLTDWIAARDEELIRKEQQHLQEANAQRQVDAERHALQQRWLTERAEAEQVIRRLLHDLLDRTSELTDSAPPAQTV